MPPGCGQDRSMVQVHADGEPHIRKKIVENAIRAEGFLKQIRLQHHFSWSIPGGNANPFLVHLTLLLRHQRIQIPGGRTIGVSVHVPLCYRTGSIVCVRLIRLVVERAPAQRRIRPRNRPPHSVVTLPDFQLRLWVLPQAMYAPVNPFVTISHLAFSGTVSILSGIGHSPFWIGSKAGFEQIGPPSL